MKVVVGLFMLISCESSWTDPKAQEAERPEIESLRNLIDDPNIRADKSIEVNTAAADLNNDGVNEILAYVQGDNVCGSGGCNLYVLRAKDGGYERISELTISRPPIRILESKFNGWHDIGVWVQGGGIQPGYEARLRFDGKSYPSNPSLAPREKDGPPKGRVVIDGSIPATPLYK